MIKPFSYRTTEKQNALELFLSGSIIQNALFPRYPNVTKLVLDLKDVNYINSTGISAFIEFLSEHSRAIIEIHNAPSVFMRQMAVLKNLKTNLFTIRSVFVPYFSEKTNESRDVLLKEGVDFFYSDAKLKLPVLQDSHGHEMEVDADPRVYFSFLVKS